MPALQTITDAPKAIGAIVGAVASGELSISEAGDLSKIIESYVRSVEALDLELRLRSLEQRQEKQK